MAASALLRAARTTAQLTQRELARRTGVSQGTIARIESGATEPRVRTLEQLLGASGAVLTAVPRTSSEVASTGSPRSTLTERAQKWLPVMVDRIVDRFYPEQIILFGSQADGTATTGSDVDLLVVLPRITDRRATRLAIRLALADVPLGKDILVTTPDDLDRRVRTRRGVMATAASSGIRLYAARPS